MKLISVDTFVLLFSLFIGLISFGQNDSISTQEEIKYIEPVVLKADLNMIVAPEGFELSDKFNGYIHFQTSSGIILTLIKDVTYLNIVKGMNDEYYKENGLTLISESEMKSDYGVKGRVYKFSFILQEMDFVRYMVYAGDLTQTLWLAITYPEKSEGLVEEEILKSIQSINLNPQER